MRLFAAIDLDEAMRARLAAVRRRFASQPGVRWVRPENLHLTLRFFGECPPERLPALETVLGALDRPRAQAIALKGLRFLPNQAAPRVFLALADAAPDLLALHERIEAAARELGFAPETRVYTPHVTLGRIRDPRRAQRLVEAAAEFRDDLGALQATAFSLFESRLTPAGPEYRQIQAWPFA